MGHIRSVPLWARIFAAMTLRQWIPNLFTLCNLACGVIAVLLISQMEHIRWCIVLIALAGLFDLLDGMVARMLGVSSELGKQLDSLADLVSFGVFPAIAIYKWVIFMEETNYFFVGSDFYSEVSYFSDPAGVVLLAGIVCLLPLAAAYRLARFNIDPEQSKEFKGLPAPANGIFWTAMLAAFLELDKEGVAFTYKQYTVLVSLIVAGVLVMSAMMVSRIRLFAFKFSDPGWANNKPRWTFVMLMPAVIAITWLSTELFFLSVPALLLLYIIISIVFQKRNEIQS